MNHKMTRQRSDNTKSKMMTLMIGINFLINCSKTIEIEEVGCRFILELSGRKQVVQGEVIRRNFT